MWTRIAGGGRLLLYILITLVAIPLQAIALASGRGRSVIPPIYHRICATVVGLEIVTRGSPVKGRPTLFVSNHVSYLDITVLGALIRGSFVAKSEVSGWAGFGFLAKLQRTVFIERGNRAEVGRQTNDMKARLEAGDSLILFPEGTSSDGNRTLPFKSALFAVAGLRVDGEPIKVQPVSLTVTRLDGLPIGVARRPLYAWYGDMDLAPHLWSVFQTGRLTVEVEFHPAVDITQFASRKALADHCQRRVAMGVSSALSGRCGSERAAGLGGGAVGAG